MKKLLKYTLVDGKIPAEIEDGGYFYDNTYLYGISVHLEESYTPEGMEWMTLGQFNTLLENYNTQMEQVGHETISKELFESLHTPFYYKTDTPKDRITVLEDLVAAILEGTI